MKILKVAGKAKVQFHIILKNLIESKAVSIREVARSTEIPASTLRTYLDGRSSQNPQHLLAISEYFHVSLEYLLFGRDRSTPSLDEVFTEDVFEGWLKVKIERAIPTKRKADPQD